MLLNHYLKCTWPLRVETSCGCCWYSFLEIIWNWYCHLEMNPGYHRHKIFICVTRLENIAKCLYAACMTNLTLYFLLLGYQKKKQIRRKSRCHEEEMAWLCQFQPEEKNPEVSGGTSSKQSVIVDDGGKSLPWQAWKKNILGFWNKYSWQSFSDLSKSSRNIFYFDRFIIQFPYYTFISMC